MSLHLEIGQVKFDASAYDAERHYRVGNCVAPGIVIVGKLKSGDDKQVYECRCKRCGNHYAVSSAQLEDARTIICGCREQRGSNGRSRSY